MDDEQSVNQLSTMPTRATAAFILSPTLTLRCMGHQRHNSTSLATNACSHVLPRHPLSNPLRPFAPARAHAARGARAALTWMSAAPGGKRGSDGEANADAEAVGGEGGAVDDEEMVDVDEDEDDEQKISPEEQRKLQGMRRRLEGLFGSENDGSAGDGLENFDGEALRQALIDRWGVQFDVQPQRRHNRVYVQVCSPSSDFLKYPAPFVRLRCVVVVLCSMLT